MTTETCLAPQFHGNPFRYCACGWIEEAAPGPAAQPRFYGDGGTIHNASHLDVEVHDGVVVAVWFRCQPLPFRAVEVDLERAGSLEDAYDRQPAPGLTGVQVIDTRGDLSHRSTLPKEIR